MANPRGAPQNLAKPFSAENPGNPGGKPVGAKNAISAKFLKELGKDFNEHGATVIAAVRADDPGRYLAIVAALVPRDDNLTVDSTVTVKDERAKIRSRITDMLAAPDAARGESPLPAGSDARH